MTDVIPFGERQFMLRLYAVSDIPDDVAFDTYHAAVCRIAWKDGRSEQRGCVVQRQSARRNVFGIQSAEGLVVLLQTERRQAELSRAAVEIERWGCELSEGEVRARLRPI